MVDKIRQTMGRIPRRFDQRFKLRMVARGATQKKASQQNLKTAKRQIYIKSHIDSLFESLGCTRKYSPPVSAKHCWPQARSRL
jgi:hypothetical protein